MTDEQEPKKKRTRKCKEIVGVTVKTVEGQTEAPPFVPVPGWPAGITTKRGAIAAAKKLQTEWASTAEKPALACNDIIIVRRLATVRGKRQVVMAFAVE